MGSIPRLSPPAAPAWKSREPPIFQYRILVCVHARRAINGKILESHSRNPDAGPGFHGSVLRLPVDLPSPLALRPFNLLPRFSTRSFRSLSRPTLTDLFINYLNLIFASLEKSCETPRGNIVDLSEVIVWQRNNSYCASDKMCFNTNYHLLLYCHFPLI